MLIARTSIMAIGAGLTAILAFGCTLPAQDASVDEADSSTDIETADAFFDEDDDPIWPIKRGIDRR